MLPSAGFGGALGSAAPMAAAAGSAFLQAAELFSTCRMPWSDYIQTATKQDSRSYEIPRQEKPMYRGRKRGKEGWLMSESVQLHYRRYPDEGIYKNLNRWLHGDVVQDVQLQQFRNVQPFDLSVNDEQGFERIPPEVYMKLNYKNPAVISRYLTRTGHYYPMDVLPINPHAILMLRSATSRARRLGLYPRTGNPFWNRSLKHRPQPHQADYDPAGATIKSTMEHFCYNWLQTRRIKQYFSLMEANTVAAAASTNAGQRASRAKVGNDVGYGRVSGRTTAGRYEDPSVSFSEKVTTVPGLMSIQGMKKSKNLYSKVSKKRMGFPNPITTSKRL